jgi:hypothetical protein
MARTKRKRLARRSAAHMEELAGQLIARHLRISIPDPAVRDTLAATQRRDVYPVDLVERPTRCIAVVGAGASAPLLKRADALATELEASFTRDEVELERLKLVNNLKTNAFETRLVALSKTPDAAREVRKRISQEYDIRHPPVLGYEFLAHLLKHRFLDAIVSFNFDELLDRSLDDELAASEYKRIVFERDCGGVQADPDAPDYVPLYIKLHGTASEPSSLRFTPDSYYSLPARIVDLTRELMHTENCILVTAGSGLGSFDFQRLLGIPRNLEVYNLSRTSIKKRVKRAIVKERKKASSMPVVLRDCSTKRDDCDSLLKHLLATLERRTASAAPQGKPRRGEIQRLVEFRTVLRHEAVTQLLGSGRWYVVATKSKWSRGNEIEYLRRRTILELAFAAVKARGLLSIVPLAYDRPARYFELYTQKTNGQGESWASLCSAGGLVEATDTPDILISRQDLRTQGRPTPKHRGRQGKRGGSSSETHVLHEFDVEKLAAHVLARVKNPFGPDDVRLLTEALRELQSQSDVELHTQDDRVCTKAFRRPTTLKTTTALTVYTWLMLHGLERGDRVHVSSETGKWLTRDSIVPLLKRQRLRVLMAFDIDESALEKKYKRRRVQRAHVNPWHHNRHMTIVCDKERPMRAIYFARHLRTPIITAVYLDSVRDVEHLMKTYEIRWDEADKVK